MRDTAFKRQENNPIKYWRLRNGMTRAELAEILGLKYDAIAKWEKNQRSPRDHRYQAISEALPGLEISKLITYFNKG